MRPELRIFLALTLIVGVFLLTDTLFPPLPPPDIAEEAAESPPATAEDDVLPLDPLAEQAEVLTEPNAPAQEERLVTVETPLYRMVLSSQGGGFRSVELPGYESFSREGPVELVRAGESLLRGLWIPGAAARESS